MTTASEKDQRGFTLIEALMAAGIFAFVLVGTVTLFASNGGVYNTGQSQAEVQQNARIALESAAREIRMAGYDPSNVIASLTNPTSIQSAASNALTLVADVTGEGTLDQVTYRLSGTRFTREFCSWTGGSFPVSPAIGTVADGVSNLTYQYFNATDGAIAAPVAAGSLASIKRITISLTTTQTTVDKQRIFPLVVDVRLRN